jgi:hypothetical protein
MNNCQFGYITKFTQPKKKKTPLVAVAHSGPLKASKQCYAWAKQMKRWKKELVKNYKTKYVDGDQADLNPNPNPIYVN